MSNSRLEHFFSADRWRQSIDRFPLSGFALVDHINAFNPKLVVDIGCGFNPFKGAIRNLVGFDLVNEHADFVCDIADAPFADGSVDIALALGSINFGSRGKIVGQVTRAARWLRPGGRLIMRANPGEPVGEGIAIFAWSRREAVDIGAEAGLLVEGPIQEEHLVLSNGVPARRLFWTYYKPRPEEAAPTGTGSS